MRKTAKNIAPRRKRRGDIAPDYAIEDGSTSGEATPPRNPYVAEQDTLEKLRQSFRDGKGLALFEAIEHCFLHNWIPPQWVVVGLYEGLNKFRAREAAEFGEAFRVRPSAKNAVAHLRRGGRHEKPSIRKVAEHGRIYGTMEQLVVHFMLNPRRVRVEIKPEEFLAHKIKGRRIVERDIPASTSNRAERLDLKSVHERLREIGLDDLSDKQLQRIWDEHKGSKK